MNDVSNNFFFEHHHNNLCIKINNKVSYSNRPLNDLPNTIGVNENG